jgi:hypothetical protein
LSCDDFRDHCRSLPSKIERLFPAGPLEAVSTTT